MNKNAIEETLKEHPFFSNPSARNLIRRALWSFQKKPSISKSQNLENYGVTMDYDEISAGIDLTRPINEE